jgi:hypothetical protein
MPPWIIGLPNDVIVRERLELVKKYFVRALSPPRSMNHDAVLRLCRDLRPRPSRL